MSRKIQNVILLVDTSGSMDGKPIESVKKAIKNLSNKIDNFNSLSYRIEFKIISFATEAKYISKNQIDNICAYGRTNLADAYRKLELIFKSGRTFDFAPIVMLLCDGRPNLCNHEAALAELEKKESFQKSFKFAFAYGEQDASTMWTLKSFTRNKENIFYDNNIATVSNILQYSLPKIIKRQAISDNNKYHALTKMLKEDVLKYKNSWRAK